MATLTRWRWRLRGAWMWPSFVVLTIVDGAVASQLPVFHSEELNAAVGWLISFILTLIAIVIFVPPLGWLVRRVRRDMPRVVARDYAGAWVCLAVTASMVISGLLSRQTMITDQRALQDATAQAAAYIGDHAPPQFQADIHRLDTYPLQPPRLYRTCVTNREGNRDYCVVVDRSKPFGHNVRYSGSEPNSVLSEGTS